MNFTFCQVTFSHGSRKTVTIKYLKYMKLNKRLNFFLT